MNHVKRHAVAYGLGTGTALLGGGLYARYGRRKESWYWNQGRPVLTYFDFENLGHPFPMAFNPVQNGTKSRKGKLRSEFYDLSKNARKFDDLASIKAYFEPKGWVVNMR